MAKKKPAQTAIVVHRFEDGEDIKVPLVKHALALIRQWVAVEQLKVTTPDEYHARESARAKLRRVAELAINAEFGMFAHTEGSRKGGQRGSNSKAPVILAEAEKRGTIGTGEIQAIATKTGASVRTVRDTLVRKGKYIPQKKNGK